MSTHILTHPDLPGQPITVAQISVARHEARGWRHTCCTAPAVHDQPAGPAKPERAPATLKTEQE